ncbi:MAG: chromosomal replication initiator protein DnaA [Candidatus Marinimicrobia bacterium]|nr:chromosomal replication initiator protein DnaA [Candidatus Neomarinimicrobiota bacterium]
MDNLNSSLKKIWDNLKDDIRDVITEQAFSTWIEPIHPVTIEDKVLTLEVPSQFYYEWIDSHYQPLIVESLKEATGEVINLRYSVVVGETRQENETTKLKQNTTSISKSYDSGSKLNKRYSFESFVEGSNNQFAKAAAIAVAESPGQTSFNPLLIYGGVGLGKTHLLQAIGNHVLNTQNENKINYMTSEKFTLDFITSIQKSSTAEFSRKYRNVDILLVDDIQFLQKKEQTQEQFFHTFNELYQQGKQIVLTMDRHPNELYGLKDRLLSRFQSGLIVDVQAPNLETRIAILQKKADMDDLEIPYEILEIIAINIKSNIREMEGALIKILAYSSLYRSDITMELAQKALKETLGNSAFNNLTIDDIIKRVSATLNVPEGKLIGKGRKMEIVIARQVAMYLSRDMVGASLVNIGLHFGGRDHTTVIHACKTVKKKMKENPEFSRKVKNLKNYIIV